MVVAPGRMIDSFLSIPDAESLPLYRMVLKLACVHSWIHAGPHHLLPTTSNCHSSSESSPSDPNAAVAAGQVAQAAAGGAGGGRSW
jgi:hypothetical protein